MLHLNLGKNLKTNKKNNQNLSDKSNKRHENKKIVKVKYLNDIILKQDPNENKKILYFT